LDRIILSNSLAFAEEYFQRLEKTREDRSNVNKLKEIQKGYKEKGLKLPLMIKVMPLEGRLRDWQDRNLSKKQGRKRQWRDMRRVRR